MVFREEPETAGTIAFLSGADGIRTRDRLTASQYEGYWPLSVFGCFLSRSRGFRLSLSVVVLSCPASSRGTNADQDSPNVLSRSRTSVSRPPNVLSRSRTSVSRPWVRVGTTKRRRMNMAARLSPSQDQGVMRTKRNQRNSNAGRGYRLSSLVVVLRRFSISRGTNAEQEMDLNAATTQPRLPTLDLGHHRLRMTAARSARRPEADRRISLTEASGIAGYALPETGAGRVLTGAQRQPGDLLDGRWGGRTGQAPPPMPPGSPTGTAPRSRSEAARRAAL